MKKAARLVCILLAAFLLFCACKQASTEPSSPEEIVGTWAMRSNEEYRYLEGFVEEDIFFTVYYIFEADGTGTTHIDDGEDLFSFTYTYDGKTLHMDYQNGDPEDIPCTITGREMHTMNGDEEVILYKQES